VQWSTTLQYKYEGMRKEWGRGHASIISQQDAMRVLLGAPRMCEAAVLNSLVVYGTRPRKLVALHRVSK
jgi:hypothetical protein